MLPPPPIRRPPEKPSPRPVRLGYDGLVIKDPIASGFFLRDGCQPVTGAHRGRVRHAVLDADRDLALSVARERERAISKAESHATVTDREAVQHVRSHRHANRDSSRSD